MNFSDFFGDAKWICAEEDVFPIFRKNFNVMGAVRKAEITILGFGTYDFYINGVRGTDAYYLPLNTHFEARRVPEDEVLGHRAIPEAFDITKLLTTGKNTLAIMLGPGWYTCPSEIERYGTPKLCYKLLVEYTNGETDCIISDETDKYDKYFIDYNDNMKDSTVSFFAGYRTLLGIEIQDFEAWDENALLPDFDDSDWKCAMLAERLKDTKYVSSDCPADKIIEEYEPKLIKETKTCKIYDATHNLTGFPRIKVNCGDVSVVFSEALDAEGNIDMNHSYNQRFEARNAKKGSVVSPKMIWFGFRYFSVFGDAEAVSVAKVHTDIKPSSDFESSNATLDWIYKAYRDTQLFNSHQGTITDCPHIERKGYTGDGQLVCPSAMRVLDIKRVFEKWIGDIEDCQDTVSGHVQYTAPYTHSGGGPGGWGSAIVKVPYEFYKYYGDDTYARRLFPNMLKYIDYLDAHSSCDFVISDKEGDWCLGDWSTPEKVILPPPYVNNYFYVKSAEMIIELARHLGREDVVPCLAEKIEKRKLANKSAYMSYRDKCFFNNVQGGNAFAIDMGIGEDKTLEHFIKYYENLSYLDTGIFGTELVIKLLFKQGRGDLAVKLLSADTPFGFGKWQKDGQLTLLEDWENARSYSHPMFGAVTAHLFDYILGIRQPEGSYGYERVIIAPMNIDGLDHAKGFITTPRGKIAVSYTKNTEGKLSVSVTLPLGIVAKFEIDGEYTVNYN